MISQMGGVVRRLPIQTLEEKTTSSFTICVNMKDLVINLQYSGTGGAHKRAHCHVGVGRAALIAIKAFPIRRQAGHLPKHLQVFLLLFSLGTRRHHEIIKLSSLGQVKLEVMGKSSA